jgi:hypothetical protein
VEQVPDFVGMLLVAYRKGDMGWSEICVGFAGMPRVAPEAVAIPNNILREAADSIYGF